MAPCITSAFYGKSVQALDPYRHDMNQHVDPIEAQTTDSGTQWGVLLLATAPVESPTTKSAHLPSISTAACPGTYQRHHS
jgi:hypothetical protein